MNMPEIDLHPSCFPRRGAGGETGVDGSDKPTLMQEMKEFTLGGNFIRIAAAFVLGLALERLVTQFVESWITPLLGIFGGKSFQDLSFTIRGSKFMYGLFLDAVISFQRHAGKCMPAWVQTFCEYCCQQIPAIATKCAHCSSDVTPKNVKYSAR